MTSDSQRRAWGLPDLANGMAAPDAAPGGVDTIEGHDAVRVVDSAEAVDLLFGAAGTGSTTKAATEAPSERADAAEHTRLRR